MDEIKALDGALVQMAKETRAAVDDVDVNGRAKKALVDGVAHSEDLQSRVQTLSSTIVELREHIKDLKGGPGFFGACIYSSWNKVTLSDMRDKLASAIRIFKLQGQISIENILSGVVQDATNIMQALKEAENQRILDSIPQAAAGCRCVDELKGEFLDGTRHVLFEELTLWSASHSPCCTEKRFYLLSGGAGLGKSSIAHHLCTRRDRPTDSEPTPGASFFFVRGRGDLESTRLLFSTLADQLALSQPTLRSHIIDAAPQYLKRGDRQQMKHAFDELLRQPLVKASISPQKPVVIVIDGLD
ncbi:NACHT domain-containing protein [Mycena venus]|uniref:NACHT domain-containing protein n=1 Tax=Mycena venus TaxID=2733690 RepID=A0A8H6YIF9_9AGAR|nr:NACHT domain-containing protein [Mycena venus]